MAIEKKHEVAQPVREFTTNIRVRAKDVVRCADGTWEIRIPNEPLRQEDFNVLRRLFPNTLEHVHMLLHKEVLLNAIVED